MAPHTGPLLHVPKPPEKNACRESCRTFWGQEVEPKPLGNPFHAIYVVLGPDAETQSFLECRRTPGWECTRPDCCVHGRLEETKLRRQVPSLDYSPDPWAQEANWSLLITLYVPHNRSNLPKTKDLFLKPGLFYLLFSLMAPQVVSG